MVEAPESLKAALHPYHRALARAERAVDLSASHAQREALNARVGHARMHGLEISIEWPAGSVRKGIGKDGKEWRRPMKFSYGRILRTKERDGDHFDVYLGPHPESELVFVVDQLTEEGKLDERKGMVGFTNLADAKAAYLAHYPDGWKDKRLGKVIPMTMKRFKDWLATNADWKKSAALLPDVSLQPHQQRLADEAAQAPVHKLLMWGLGAGKSPGALAAAEARGEPYTVVAPAALRANWNKERERFTDRQTPADTLSYTEVAQGKPTPHLGSLVVDEAQALRNAGSKRTMAIADLARKAKQLVLLSGTPATNRPGELAPLMSMLTGSQITPGEFEDRYVGQKEVSPGLVGRLMGVTPGVEPDVSHREELKALLEGHVDFYQPEKPVVPTDYEDVHVEMSPLQSRIYQAMLDRLPWHLRYKLKKDIGLTRDELHRALSFLSGPRQVSLSPYPYMKSKDPYQAFEHSPKLQKAMAAMKEVLADPRAKGIVHSNYIDAGLTPYSAALARENIPHAIFHGGLSDEERRRLVEDFNAGKTRVALVGPSGAEGISLRGAQVQQLLDPHWNSARSNQQSGRGLRYDSHFGLPEELQRMKIQRFISRLPLGLKDRLLEHVGFDRTGSRRASDDFLRAMSTRKDRELGVFMDLLKEVGSQKRAELIHTHTDRLSDGTHRTLDVLKLIDRVKSRVPLSIDINNDVGVHQISRSRSSGFSRKRYDAADTSYPVLLDGDRLIDGRHRLVKLLDRAVTTVLAHRLTPSDIATATLPSKTAAPGGHSLIDQLREAKRYSDSRQWEGKMSILLPLIRHDPSAWIVDQDDPSSPVVGLKHTRTSWRFHLPRTAVAGLGVAASGSPPGKMVGD
jgi:hypothetical protein